MKRKLLNIKTSLPAMAGSNRKPAHRIDDPTDQRFLTYNKGTEDEVKTDDKEPVLRKNPEKLVIMSV